MMITGDCDVSLLLWPTTTMEVNYSLSFLQEDVNEWANTTTTTTNDLAYVQ